MPEDSPSRIWTALSSYDTLPVLLPFDRLPVWICLVGCLLAAALAVYVWSVPLACSAPSTYMVGYIQAYCTSVHSNVTGLTYFVVGEILVVTFLCFAYYLFAGAELKRRVETMKASLLLLLKTNADRLISDANNLLHTGLANGIDPLGDAALNSALRTTSTLSALALLQQQQRRPSAAVAVASLDSELNEWGAMPSEQIILKRFWLSARLSGWDVPVLDIHQVSCGTRCSLYTVLAWLQLVVSMVFLWINIYGLWISPHTLSFWDYRVTIKCTNVPQVGDVDCVVPFYSFVWFTQISLVVLISALVLAHVRRITVIYRERVWSQTQLVFYVLAMQGDGLLNMPIARSLLTQSVVSASASAISGPCGTAPAPPESASGVAAVAPTTRLSVPAANAHVYLLTREPVVGRGPAAKDPSAALVEMSAAPQRTQTVQPADSLANLGIVLSSPEPTTTIHSIPSGDLAAGSLPYRVARTSELDPLRGHARVDSSDDGTIHDVVIARRDTRTAVKRVPHSTA